MVQILPETSNSNIWQQAAKDATVGWFQGKEIAKSRELEREKNTLLQATYDPAKSEIEKASAMQQYLGKFGKPEDIIRYQKEQGRMKATSDLMNLINGQNPPQNTGDLAQDTGANLSQLGGGAPANAPPIQNTQDLFQGGAPDKSKFIDQALVNLAQYDPQTAKTISDVLGRKQKDEIAQQNQQLKQQKINQDAEQFRQNKILPIQDNAITTIKRTNGLIKAGNDQLAVIDSTGVWSAANISKILAAAGYDAAAKAAESEGGAIFKTAGKEIITGGLKEAFGARPLGIEFQAYEDMQAQIGRKKEVNELAIKSILAEPTIQNEVAKYQMQVLTERPDISPIELNNLTFKYEEEVTDRVFKEWEQYRDKAIESMKDKSFSWFGSPKKQAPQEQKQESQPASWQDIWK